MLTRELDYELPEELIAQQPLPERGQSRLLVLDRSSTTERAPEQRLAHRLVADWAQLVPPGALVVLNDTRVMKARVFGRRRSGARVELLFLNPSPSQPRRWEVLLKANRRLPEGDTVLVGDHTLEIQGASEQGTRWVLCDVDVAQLLEEHGHVPLPPYVRRPDEDADAEAYQTVFARHWGSAAAPTAGLHLTPGLLSQLQQRGVELGYLTLHVGAGTFRPVSAPSLAEHAMHVERYSVSPALAEQVAAAKLRGAPVIAVGTTVVRALESAALAGAESQATAGQTPHTFRIATGERSTQLLIAPGYTFRVVDALLTNFHAPCSTLLALVFAFAGTECIRAAYAEAIAQRYRFLSYGDAMWISPRSN